MRTPWPMIWDHKKWKVEEARKFAFDAQNLWRALEDTPVATPLECQWPGDPSLGISLQARDAVTLQFCWMFCPRVYDIDSSPKLYIVEPEDKYHSRTVGRWGTSNSYALIPVWYALQDRASDPGLGAPVPWCIYLHGGRWSESMVHLNWTA